jgi:23S rRNA (cytidine1920-2'-O)/16S rRNA (cytidine1409-2'-O)-methyltransferase
MSNDRFILPEPGAVERSFFSRAGQNLEAAITTLRIDCTNLVAADLGCNVGGFTDCLLQHGVARAYAVDTGYGTLAWKLRKDPRVVVMERVNALHVTLPEPVNLITIDVAWTRQDKILPKAAQLLAPAGRVLTLIKPHYESDRAAAPGPRRHGVLDEHAAITTLNCIADEIEAGGWHIDGIVKSPLIGQGGNIEFIAHLRRA